MMSNFEEIHILSVYNYNFGGLELLNYSYGLLMCNW